MFFLGVLLLFFYLFSAKVFFLLIITNLNIFFSQFAWRLFLPWNEHICISYICIVGILLLAALTFQSFFYCEPLKITTMICIRDTGHLKLTQGFIHVCTICTLVILSMVILRCAMFYSDQQRPCTLHQQILSTAGVRVPAEDFCRLYSIILFRK